MNSEICKFPLFAYPDDYLKLADRKYLSEKNIFVKYDVTNDESNNDTPPNIFKYCEHKMYCYNIVEWVRQSHLFGKMACWAAQGGCLVSDCNNIDCNMRHQHKQHEPLYENNVALFRVISHLYEILALSVPLSYFASNLEIFDWIIGFQRGCGRPYIYSEPFYPAWATDPADCLDDINELHEIHKTISEQDEQKRINITKAIFYRNKEISDIKRSPYFCFEMDYLHILDAFENIVNEFYDNSWYESACLEYKETTDYKKIIKTLLCIVERLHLTICYNVVDIITEWFMPISTMHPIMLLIKQLADQIVKPTIMTRSLYG